MVPNPSQQEAMITALSRRVSPPFIATMLEDYHNYHHNYVTYDDYYHTANVLFEALLELGIPAVR